QRCGQRQHDERNDRGNDEKDQVFDAELFAAITYVVANHEQRHQYRGGDHAEEDRAHLCRIGFHQVDHRAGNSEYRDDHAYAQGEQQAPRNVDPVFTSFLATAPDQGQRPADERGGGFDELLIDADDQGDGATGDAGDGFDNADQGASNEVAYQRGSSLGCLAHLLTIL